MLLLALACSEPPETPSNVLIVLIDDVGTDIVSAYGHGDDAVQTPNIDALADQGVLFRRAYAHPMCSPTRAALLTGRYADRFGIGYHLLDDDVELPVDAATLPRVLPGHDNAAVGKWHLTSRIGTGTTHPTDAGWNSYAGTLFNVDVAMHLERPLNWRTYEKVVDGIEDRHDAYPTVDTTTDALDAMQRLEPPWLLYVSYNAAHGPIHTPPADLLQRDLPPDDKRERYLASVEILDTQIGRLLADVPDDTVVLLLGDNGTSRHGVGPTTRPKQRKGTMNEGGVRIPFIAAGPGVAHGESDALVHVVDILPTLADLAGQPVPDIDGESFRTVLGNPVLPARDFVYSSMFKPNGPGPYTTRRVMVRGERYKLVRRDGEESLHDLLGRVSDGPTLLSRDLTSEEQAAHARLSAELDRLEGIGL